MATRVHKRANEVLDYSFDWGTSWLGSDTISTSTWTVPAGITQDSETESTTVATIWVSGGTAGTEYDLVNKIVTVGGRTAEQVLTVVVLPAASMYVTVDEVKAQSPSVEYGTTWDTLIADLIVAACEFVDKTTRREVGAYDASATAAARWFDAEGGKYLGIDECTSVTAVTMRRTTGTTETSLTSTDYRTWPYNAGAGVGPIVRLDIDDRQGSYSCWPTGREAVKVTATWGYSDDPPAVVKQAASIQVIRWLKRGEQMYADSSLMPEAGRLTYARALDPDLEQLLLKSGLVKAKDLF